MQALDGLRVKRAFMQARVAVLAAVEHIAAVRDEDLQAVRSVDSYGSEECGAAEGVLQLDQTSL